MILCYLIEITSKVSVTPPTAISECGYYSFDVNLALGQALQFVRMYAFWFPFDRTPPQYLGKIPTLFEMCDTVCLHLGLDLHN